MARGRKDLLPTPRRRGHPVKHIEIPDYPRNGRWLKTWCGKWVTEADVIESHAHASVADCEACRDELQAWSNLDV